MQAITQVDVHNLSIRDFPVGTRLKCSRTLVMTFDDSEAFTAGREYVVGSIHVADEPAHVRLINNQGASHRMQLEHLTRYFSRPSGLTDAGHAPKASKTKPTETVDASAATPTSMAAEIDEHVQLIREVFRGDNKPLSTGQMLMVGLATCQTKLLEDACYPPLDAREAWQALEEAQRQAIIDWWQQ